MVAASRIVIATPHERHNGLEQSLRERLGLNVLRVRDPVHLQPDALRAFQPDYVFFPHWSWMIPAEVHEAFECVIFHMTDLPFGRGGSPLQNLIVRGLKETQLTALRCVADLDAGPIYMKIPMSLVGTAEEILLRAAYLTERMIERIVQERPLARPQGGEVTIFRRRTPKDGDLVELDDLGKLFDHIRMLDATGYPPAFVETRYFRFEFSRASLKSDGVIADVKITRKKP